MNKSAKPLVRGLLLNEEGEVENEGHAFLELDETLSVISGTVPRQFSHLPSQKDGIDLREYELISSLPLVSEHSQESKSSFCNKHFAALSLSIMSALAGFGILVYELTSNDENKIPLYSSGAALCVGGIVGAIASSGLSPASVCSFFKASSQAKPTYDALEMSSVISPESLLMSP